MVAELNKLRFLPTPRWTFVVCLGFAVVGSVVALFDGSVRASTYVDAGEVITGVGTVIGSIVLGVWIAGVEYGQNTMRRVLAADPRRGRLFAAKLAIAVAGSLALTVLVWLVSIGLLSFAASANSATSPTHDLFTTAAKSLLSNPIYAAIGCAVAMLARSMAGGMTAMLALVFVLDTALTALPVGDISLGGALRDLGRAIEGHSGQHVGHAVRVVFAWLVILLTAAWVRFTRSDVT
jgi:ABC-2 type transport system permease protein